MMIICVFRDLGMEGLSSHIQILNLMAYLVLFRGAAYLALRYRLTVGVSSRLRNYVRKILNRHK